MSLYMFVQGKKKLNICRQSLIVWDASELYLVQGWSELKQIFSMKSNVLKWLFAASLVIAWAIILDFWSEHYIKLIFIRDIELT